MNRMSQWIFGVIMAATVSGCIVRSGPGGGGTMTGGSTGGGGAVVSSGGGGGGGGAVVRIVNNSNTSICYVRFSPESAPSWNGTPDSLGSATIASGSAADFSINAGTWDVMLESCNPGNNPFGHTTLYEGRHTLNAGGSYALSFP